MERHLHKGKFMLCYLPDKGRKENSCSNYDSDSQLLSIQNNPYAKVSHF